jgi:hypothetical protein
MEQTEAAAIEALIREVECDDREQAILRQRYTGAQPRTMAQVAAGFALTTQRLQQIETALILRLARSGLDLPPTLAANAFEGQQPRNQFLRRQREAARRRCVDCEKPTKAASPYCPEHRQLVLSCSVCGTQFTRKRAIHARRGRDERYGDQVFCGRRCFGIHIGRTAGFGSPGHPYRTGELGWGEQKHTP